ncbi:ArsR/SmtB family transcription factor [Burkholderia gladioli]|uniref:ArsR/SmtB family transcription factor n=1 Tax=Burkholderia gladioli TaxID=28095 RepID=UPI001C5F2987|nr:metalloregulator ArsR/SmtB family transcription factor [Burkholderia gladioli]MBW5287224.1 helix-turn-helix transcriptional regulator [Burkholderia gladioli]
MKNQEAILAFSALAQETRLNIFRVLVRAGPEGLAAGRIAELLDKGPSALSFHFKEMAIAGLVHVRQEGRFVVYAANYGVVHGLVEFLMEHCCEGAESSPRVTGKASCGTAKKKTK